MSKEAMKLALEALIAATPVKAKDPQMQADAIVALREALAEQPAQQEPVANEQEREAFETHWYSFYHSGSVSARSDGSYVHPHVQRAWEAWQVRAAQE